MCAVAVSPGVYSKEVDFSLYAPRLASTICAMVGTASKGATDERVLITDEGTLIETFGPPTSDHPAIYAAQQYLKSGRNLWFVRVANYDTTAAGALRDGGDTANAVTLQASSSGSWGNSLRVIVEASTGTGYRITITYNNVVVEKKDGVLVGSANAGDQRYIETQFASSLYVAFSDSGSYTTLKVGTSTSTWWMSPLCSVNRWNIVGMSVSPPRLVVTCLESGS